MGKLLVTIKPFEDETLASYILRNCMENYYENMSWLTDLAGIKKRQLAKPNPKKVNIKSLAQLCNIEEELLWETTFLKDILYFENKNELVAFKDQASSEYDKICPECFKDFPFQRKFWNIKINFACPLHSLLLINTCPECKKKILSTRRVLKKCNCGYSLLELPKIPLEDYYVAHSKILYNAYYKRKTFLLKDNSPITNLDHYSLTRLINSFWYRLNGGRVGIGVKQINTQCQETLNLLVKVFDIFLAWPNNFNKYLKENTNETIHKNIRRDLLGKLDSAELEFVKIGYASFLEKTLHRSVSLNKVNYGELVSYTETIKILGMGSESINNLINNDVLKEDKIYQKGYYTRSITSRSIEEFLKLKKYIVFKKDIANELGLGPKLVNELEKGGWINRIELFSKKNPTKSYYDIREAYKFLKRFDRYIQEITTKESSVLIHFSKLQNRAAVKGISFIELIQILIEGQLRIYQIKDTIGFREFFFNLEDVLSQIKVVRYKKLKQGLIKLNLSEVSSLLDISQPTISSWVKLGFFGKECKDNLVGYQQIIHFLSSYISLKILAEYNKTAVRNMKEMLEDNSIRPASGPEIDGSLGYLYSLGDVHMFFDKEYMKGKIVSKLNIYYNDEPKDLNKN